MIKKLSLLTAALTLSVATAFADQPTVYNVKVVNNTSPATNLYLTAASAPDMSKCTVFWPDSKLTSGGTTPFTLECWGNLPPALKLSFITHPIKQKNGQTCWVTYSTAQFVDSGNQIPIHPYFSSSQTCENPANPPPILPNHPAPPTN